MKKAILLVSAAILSLGASAQYVCTTEGSTMEYSVTVHNDKDTKTLVTSATISSVTTADGITTVVTHEVTPIPDSPLGQKTEDNTTIYNAADNTTKYILSTPEEAKQEIIDMIKMQAEAAGQSVSVADLDELSSAIKVKGELSLTISPDMTPETKIANQSMRLTVMQETISYSLWNIKVLGTESCTTAAGTFDCIKVQYVNRITSPQGNEKLDCMAWFAPGVGLVKQEQSLKGKPVMNQELTKFQAK